MEIRKTICPYDCPTSCGLIANTDGKTIFKIEGDKDHPATEGLICNKMRNYPHSIHSKDRILTPLKRIGNKGEGNFKPITWDEAINEICSKWKDIIKNEGPSAILPMYYSGVMSVIHRKCGDAFFNKMGACSIVKTLCSSAKGEGYKSVMGSTGALEPRELEFSDYYIVWGSNMKATRLQSLSTIIKARKEGKKVVLIETYKKPMEQYCDETILIRPGTDGALALAMMNVMLKENLQDEKFLQENTIGYETFKYTLDKYTPEWAKKITGIPEDIIINLAREYSKAKAPAIILGSGNSRYTNGGMTVRLITILSIFTGAIKNKGGGLCGVSPSSYSYIDSEVILRNDLRTNEPKVVNINQISSALTDIKNPIKSFYVYGGNPVCSVSNQNKMIRGLLREDLFTVVHERFMTDTAKYADIILPATFSVEQTDVYTSYGYCTLATAKKIINPPGECKSNWDTFSLLAKAMGYEDEYFKMTQEEIFDELLEKSLKNSTLISQKDKEVLKEGGSISTPFANHMDIKTLSGKIQITNEEFEEIIPRYIANNNHNYPLNLVAVPHTKTLNSIFLEHTNIINQRGKVTLKINTIDATNRGIKDKDIISCFNDFGEVEFVAKVSNSVCKGAVIAEGVYNMDFAINNRLVNALHEDRISDMGAATTLNGNTVEIRKKL